MALEILDRVPTKPGRVLITPEDGSAPFYAVMSRADEPEQEGTPINKKLLDNMTKAVNVNVSTEVQELLGADNVDDCFSSGIPTLLSDYVEIQLIRTFSVDTSSGGSLGTVVSQADSENFDCFIVKLEDFTVSLKASSSSNWGIANIYLRPMNGSTIVTNSTTLSLGEFQSINTSTAYVVDMSNKKKFFTASFPKRYMRNESGTLSTIYAASINGDAESPGYSNATSVALIAYIAYQDSSYTKVKGNVKVYGLKYKL